MSRSQKHSPAAWHATFPKPPVLSSTPDWKGALVRRWRSTSPEMSQPPLDRHYLTLHLGGPKRVVRRFEGRTLNADVPFRGVTFMPAGTSATWHTEGPIDFAHLYLRPSALDYIIAQTFDRDPARVSLRTPVGLTDPLLSSLFCAILRELEAPRAGSRAYLDGLLSTLAIQLVRLCSDLDGATGRARRPLAPHVLRRVLDYIEAHFREDVGLGDLARVAGQSPHHFSRAFRMATGLPPYAYLVRRRLAEAKTMLHQGPTPIAAVAQRCGFNSRTQFATMFRKQVGVTPSQFRRDA